MPDLDRIIDAALADADPPPDMLRLERIVQRRKRRRRMLASGALAMMLVVPAAVVVVTREGGKTRVSAENATDARTTAPSIATPTVFATDDLVRELTARHHHVRVDKPSTPPAASFFGVRPITLCVDQRVVRVYQYGDTSARERHSRGIGRDGSQITIGHGVASIDWIGPPHFYARGRIIVLYIGDQQPLIHDLSDILGATLSPDAFKGPGLHEETC